MAQATPDISIRLSVLNAQGQHLGGSVNIDVKPQNGGQALTMKAADASQDIDIGGLQRTPNAVYQVTVTPSGTGKPVTQNVTVPATGFATAKVTVDSGAAVLDAVRLPSNNVSGTLVFDNGVPAAGITVRAYHIGFAGQSSLLETAQA